MQTKGCGPERIHLLGMEPHPHVLIQRVDGKTGLGSGRRVGGRTHATHDRQDLLALLDSPPIAPGYTGLGFVLALPILPTAYLVPPLRCPDMRKGSEGTDASSICRLLPSAN